MFKYKDLLFGKYKNVDKKQQWSETSDNRYCFAKDIKKWLSF